MITLSFVMSKGGVGKSTLVIEMAVQAVKAGRSVGILDLNAGQGSATDWWSIRRFKAGGVLENPTLLQPDDPPERIAENVSRHGVDTIMVDTPPMDLDTISAAIRIADVALLPIQAGAFEIMAHRPTVDLCRAHGVKWAFVPMDVRSGRDTKRALDVLAKAGPILPAQMRHNAAFPRAPLTGQAASEINETAAQDAAQVWEAIMAMVGDDEQ